MSDLDLQIKELRSCGETIIEIANTLAGMFSSQAAEDAPPKEKPKVLTLEEVRHRMTVIAQAGYSAEVKALITKYGARKLSDIAPSQYEELLKEAKEEHQKRLKGGKYECPIPKGVKPRIISAKK